MTLLLYLLYKRSKFSSATEICYYDDGLKLQIALFDAVAILLLRQSLQRYHSTIALITTKPNMHCNAAIHILAQTQCSSSATTIKNNILNKKKMEMVLMGEQRENYIDVNNSYVVT